MSACAVSKCWLMPARALTGSERNGARQSATADHDPAPRAALGEVGERGGDVLEARRTGSPSAGSDRPRAARQRRASRRGCAASPDAGSSRASRRRACGCTCRSAGSCGTSPPACPHSTWRPSGTSRRARLHTHLALDRVDDHVERRVHPSTRARRPRSRPPGGRRLRAPSSSQNATLSSPPTTAIDARALRDAELHDRRAEPAGGAEHDDGLAGGDAPAPDGGVVRGVRGNQEPAGVFVGHASGTSKIVEIPTDTGARLPNGWIVTAATRRPMRSRRPGAASTTTPTPSWPEMYGRATGTGIRAAAHRHVGQRERGDGHAHDHPVGERLAAFGQRRPPGEAHRHPREVGAGRLGDLVEHERVRRLAEPCTRHARIRSPGPGTPSRHGIVRPRPRGADP